MMNDIVAKGFETPGSQHYKTVDVETTKPRVPFYTCPKAFRFDKKEPATIQSSPSPQSYSPDDRVQSTRTQSPRIKFET